jgi:hypothetical protein
MPEERDTVNLELEIVRFAQYPTPQDFLNTRDGWSYLTVVVVEDTGNGDKPRSMVFINAAKGALRDRDQLFYYRHLCKALSGYESINWNIDPRFVNATDAQIAGIINSNM